MKVELTKLQPTLLSAPTRSLVQYSDSTLMPPVSYDTLLRLNPGAGRNHEQRKLQTVL